MGQVAVCNVRQAVPAGYTRIYVGRRSSYRPALGEDFSLLGNPYPVPRYSRADAIAAYSARLSMLADSTPSRQALAVLRERIRGGEQLALMCWCAPQACHADVLKELLEATP